MNSTHKKYTEYDFDNDILSVLKDLLLYHSIKKIDHDRCTLTLDSGLELKFVGNLGCSGCTSGNYDITEFCPDVVDNVITNVSIVESPMRGDWQTYSYELFIYAEDKEMKLLRCEGDDGNGCYGTGFCVRVFDIPIKECNM